jgi:hypothetical protein
MRRLRRAKQALTALSLLCAGIVGTAAAGTFPGRSGHHAATVTRTDSGAGVTARSRAAHRTGTAPSRRTHRSTPARSQTTSPAPSPPATTPAPAPATSASVTSGGS